MLGLAAGLARASARATRRATASSQPDYLRNHGGVVGEALFWVTRTLFSAVGAHILFVFLFLAGRAAAHRRVDRG